MCDFASTNVSRRGGATCSSDEIAVIAMERRGCVIQPKIIANRKREEL